jgi:hypothetical protein
MGVLGSAASGLLTNTSRVYPNAGDIDMPIHCSSLDPESGDVQRDKLK